MFNSRLQLPKSGTSRFSKLLPAVPGLNNKNNSPLPLPPPPAATAASPIVAQTPTHSPLRSLREPPPPPPTKALPDPPSASSSSAPPVRPPANIGKPADSPLPLPLLSPLPPLPTLEAPGTGPGSSPSGPPPRMSIPRRPVGKLLPPAPSPQYLQQPSPTDSFSSLLSAYTRDPDESPWNLSSSETTPASLRKFEESAPAEDAASLSRRENGAPTLPFNTKFGSGPRPVQPQAATAGSGNGNVNGSRSGIGAGAGAGIGAAAGGLTQSSRRPVDLDRNLPPPPTQNDDAQPSTPPAIGELPAASPDLATASPPPAEIWRRRPHVSQNSRELPGLKLDYSHGSSAATVQPSADGTDSQSQSQLESQPQLHLQSQQRTQLPSQLTDTSDTAKPAAPPPRIPPFAGGLPGRNVRPSSSKKRPPSKELPSKEPPPSSESQNMGGEASKLRHLKDKLSTSQRSTSDSSIYAANGLPPRPSAQRPPTPEYQKEDVKAPTVDSFISPVSPASSSDAQKQLSTDMSKKLPSQPAQRDGTQDDAQNGLPKSVVRKALPMPGQSLSAAKSLPQLKADPPAQVNGSFYPMSNGNTDSSTRGSPPNNGGGASGQSYDSGETIKFPPRTASMRTDVQRPPMDSLRYAPADMDPRLVQSESQGPMYRGRDGTLYPEMKYNQEPHPLAASFPMPRNQSLPQGGVFRATPIRPSHYQCYQKHRVMNRRTNKHYPLSCQTCEKADTEDRWTCTFCNLRICEPCLRKLNGHQKELRLLINDLANSAPLSLNSQARPGSALGLLVS